MSVVMEPVKRPMRKRSGTAKWHMSREAVSLPLEELYGMDEEACWRFFVEARFGSKDTVRCLTAARLAGTTCVSRKEIWPRIFFIAGQIGFHRLDLATDNFYSWPNPSC
jgi:hypothetical protein